jgi:hypothetical protein
MTIQVKNLELQASKWHAPDVYQSLRSTTVSAMSRPDGVSVPVVPVSDPSDAMVP